MTIENENDYDIFGLTNMSITDALDYLNEVEDDYRLGIMKYEDYAREHEIMEKIYPEFYYNIWLLQTI